MGQVAIVVNGDQPQNLYPAFVMGASAVASGDDVLIFFCPAAGPALKKGVLESMTAKGMPDMKDLVEGVEMLGGRIRLCELALEAKDIKEEELREDIEIGGATSFLADIQNANIVLTF